MPSFGTTSLPFVGKVDNCNPAHGTIIIVRKRTTYMIECIFIHPAHRYVRLQEHLHGTSITETSFHIELETRNSKRFNCAITQATICTTCNIYKEDRWLQSPQVERDRDPMLGNGPLYGQCPRVCGLCGKKRFESRKILTLLRVKTK